MKYLYAYVHTYLLPAMHIQ